MMPYYEILKDFAVPVATVIAAIVAAGITWHFGRTQARIAHTQAEIAKSQAAIAYDKLKFDLFERRYMIFQAAKSLIQYVTRLKHANEIDHHKIDDLQAQLEEARFFFEMDIQVYLAELGARSTSCVYWLTEMAKISSTEDKAAWESVAEKMGTDWKRLVEMYNDLPNTFHSALAFGQVAGTEYSKATRTRIFP